MLQETSEIHVIHIHRCQLHLCWNTRQSDEINALDWPKEKKNRNKLATQENKGRRDVILVFLPLHKQVEHKIRAGDSVGMELKLV